MIWQIILEIILRILAGFISVSFIVSLALYNKYPKCETIFIHTGFVTLFYGFGRLLIYAIAGV